MNNTTSPTATKNYTTQQQCDEEVINVGNCSQKNEQTQYDVESFGGRLFSPPAVVYHVDYRSKAEQRKAELNVLRQKNLARPQGKATFRLRHPTLLLR